MMLSRIKCAATVAGMLALSAAMAAGETKDSRAKRDTAPRVSSSAGKKSASSEIMKRASNRVTVSVSGETLDHNNINLDFGHAITLKFDSPALRISVADPKVADVTMVSPSEAILVGKAIGTTNLVYWGRSGETRAMHATVKLDLAPLRNSLALALPAEKGIEVHSASGAVLLTGSVSDTIAADTALTLAEAYIANMGRLLGGSAGNSTAISINSPSGTTSSPPGGSGSPGGPSGSSPGARIVNSLKISAPQQVMLEVKIAEVSKTLLEQLGLTLQGANGTGNAIKWGIMSDVLGGNAAIAGLLFNNGKNLIDLDAQKRDGLVKILAEPNIVAMSGQQGSFLAGGRLFIPVTQPGVSGSTTTLAEREVGIGLKFLPTVLDNGRINLMVAPEVSEIAKEGVALVATANGAASLLPFITTRRVSTTVQLRDGQSIVIGGLIKNNVSQTVRAIPILGELPILGPLFRSSEFASDKTELVVAVSATIVKPTDETPALPTDKFTTPSRGDFLLKGKMESNTGSDK